MWPLVFLVALALLLQEDKPEQSEKDSPRAADRTGEGDPPKRDETIEEQEPPAAPAAEDDDEPEPEPEPVTETTTEET